MKHLPRIQASLLACAVACLDVLLPFSAPCLGQVNGGTISFRETDFADATVGEETPLSTGTTRPTMALPSKQALVILDAACPRCDSLLAELEKPNGDFHRMRANGWKIGPEASAHVRVLDKTEAEALLGATIKMQLPTVVGVESGRVVRSFKSGCSTPLDMWTFHWLVTGMDERPTPAPILAVSVPTTGNYPLRGGHWSVDGDWHPTRERVLYHLRGANHAHQIRLEWTLETWSREELRSLHDNLHELEAHGRTTVYSSQVNALHYRPATW